MPGKNTKGATMNPVRSLLTAMLLAPPARRQLTAPAARRFPIYSYVLCDVSKIDPFMTLVGTAEWRIEGRRFVRFRTATTSTAWCRWSRELVDSETDRETGLLVFLGLESVLGQFRRGRKSLVVTMRA